MDHLAPSSGVNWYSYNPFGDLLGGSQLPPMELGGFEVGRQLAPQVQYTAAPQLAVNSSSVHYSQDNQNSNLVENVEASHQDLLLPSAEPKSRVRSALGEKITCQECGATFACGANLRNHLRIHTGERPYICEECGASFTQRSNLRSHKRVHTGERPYMCGICGQTFARSSHLPGHMRTHTGEKPFDCPHCSRSFATNQIMKNHMRTHTGERPFVCEVCDATFAQSSVLATHKKIHTGERNYKCSLCGKAFISRSGLQTHERVHTGEKPYTCEKCYKSFKTSSYLSKHKQKYCGNNGYKNRVERPDMKKPDRKVPSVRKMEKSVDGVKANIKHSKKFVSKRLRRSRRNRTTEAEVVTVDDASSITEKDVSMSSACLEDMEVKQNLEDMEFKQEILEAHDTIIGCVDVEMDLVMLQQCRSQENQDPLGIKFKDEKYYVGANASGSVHQDSKQIDKNRYETSEHCSQLGLGEHDIDLEEDVCDVLREEFLDEAHCDSGDNLDSASQVLLENVAEDQDEHLFMSRTGEITWYSKSYI